MSLDVIHAGRIWIVVVLFYIVMGRQLPNRSLDLQHERVDFNDLLIATPHIIRSSCKVDEAGGAVEEAVPSLAAQPEGNAWPARCMVREKDDEFFKRDAIHVIPRQITRMRGRIRNRFVTQLESPPHFLLVLDRT